MVCVRKAWLTLPGRSLPLEDAAKGYFCTQLDLGFPSVREVVNNRPDRDGVDDRTSLMGSRVISADITALHGAGAIIDQVASSFAPYMIPTVRPVLHYILDRPGAKERTIVMRGSAYSWPIVGSSQREIHLAWVASDPAILDPVIQQVTAWAGGGEGFNGRAYDLEFDRVYPSGSTQPTVAIWQTKGDIPVQPHYRIFGPITQPEVYTVTSPDYISSLFAMMPTYRLDEAHWLDVDTAAKTAYHDSDPRQPAMSSIDWSRTTWPIVPPAPTIAYTSIEGSSTNQVTQLVVSWQDSYLT